MALLRAYPKGSTEPLVWEIPPGVNQEVLDRVVAPVHVGDVVVVPTVTGRLRLDPSAYGALEIVRTEDPDEEFR